jgi:predicted Zn-dependent protease
MRRRRGVAAEPAGAARLPQFTAMAAAHRCGGRGGGKVRAALSGWTLCGLALVGSFAAMICGACQVRAHDAQGAPTTLRDTEIENDIRTLATPIWRAAGLAPSDVAIYLIDDDQINSFVAGGQAIFLNSGLIERAENPNQLIGVIAHETGHIAGGHILTMKEEMHNASVETIIAMVLAAGAAVAGQSGAPLLGAAGIGERHYLQYSIAQEATADHAALNFLDRACMSARGLLRFFEILQSNEMLAGDRENEWTMDHPLTQQRIEYVRDHVANARCSNAPDRPGSAALLRLIQVKLHAFLDPPSATLADYPLSDTSVLARYARAIAYYRIPDLDKALPTIDGLIRDFPNDPYYRELKGQMLFENGRVREAIRPYEDAVRLAPSAALLRISLSQVYIETADPALNKRAIAYLDDASREEGRDSEVWHFLAVAYGRDHQMGMAALSLAEEALANNKNKEAIQQTIRAKQLLARNTPAYARAEEIHREAKADED